MLGIALGSRKYSSDVRTCRTRVPPGPGTSYIAGISWMDSPVFDLHSRVTRPVCDAIPVARPAIPVIPLKPQRTRFGQTAADPHREFGRGTWPHRDPYACRRYRGRCGIGKWKAKTRARPYLDSPARHPHGSARGHAA